MAMELSKWVGDFKLAPSLLFLVITCLSCSMIPALSVNKNIYHNAATLESYPEYVTLHKSRNVHGTVHMSARGTEDWKAGWREGFGMELVHMDSPSSPFAKRDASRAELHSQLLNRESARTHALGKHISHVHSKPKSSKAGGAGAPAGTALKDPVTSGLNSGTGEYFVKLQVGTPAKDVIATIDTGSDIFWLQCNPCQECYQQIGPVFEPLNSTSFLTLKCASPICSQLQFYKCGKQTKNCLYAVAYGDGSVTVGTFSQDTLTLTSTTGNPFQIPQFSFGCGHVNQGLFVGSGGILGLGRGKLSLPSQLAGKVANQFTYCLTDRFLDPNANSHIFFGDTNSVGLQYTPLTQNPKLPEFYYVSLTGISVGQNVITFPASLYTLDATGAGGIILDSGTSITRLMEPSYSLFRDSFRAATTYLKRVDGDTLFDTCYNVPGDTAKIPAVSLLFQNKATLPLPANNILLPVDAQGTYCLAFAPSWVNISIIGNVQQQNFRIEYDLANSRVGFERIDCSAQ